MTTEAKKKTEREPNVYTALLAAQKSCKGVGKGGQVSYGDKYKYTGIEEMIAGTRDHLHKAGLVLIPLSPTLDLDIRPNNVEGSKAFGTAMVDAEGNLVPVINVSWQLYHPESDTGIVYRMPWPVIEDRGRKMDKAVATAMSSAAKYFLRDLLLIPRGIEKGDDMEERPDVQTSAPTQRAVPTKKRRGKNETAFMKDLATWASLKGKPTGDWKLAMKRVLVRSSVQEDGDDTMMTEPKWSEARAWMLAAVEQGIGYEEAVATSQAAAPQEEPQSVPF